MLIRSLVNNPELLILDEPTTGLDPQARHIIWQRLRSLKSSGKTMILTTHYMEEAAQLCDRLYMIDRGKILAEGRPQELIHRYVGKEVLEIRLQKKEKDRLLERLEGLDFESEEVEETLYLVPRDSEAVLRRLVEFDVQELQRRPSTLEDLFFKLTGRGLHE
jgi:lipooligosaccharide transport system ATP-binding protein